MRTHYARRGCRIKRTNLKHVVFNILRQKPFHLAGLLNADYICIKSLNSLIFFNKINTTTKGFLMQPINLKPLFSIHNNNPSKIVTRNEKIKKDLDSCKFERIFHQFELMGEICSYLSTSNIYSIKGINRFFNANGNEIITTSFLVQLRAMKTVNLLYMQKYTEFWPNQIIKDEVDQSCKGSLPKMRRVHIGDILSYCTNAEKLIQFNNSECLPIFFNIELLQQIPKMPNLKMIKSCDRGYAISHNFITPDSSMATFTSQMLSLSKSLESIRLFSHSNFSDSDLSLISKINTLKSLHLENISITEEVIKSFASLPNLTRLGLVYFEGERLQNLVSCIADCLPKLQDLALRKSLERQDCQNQWCRDFSKIARLQSLKIGDVNEEDLKLIVSGTRITKLTLMNSQVPNEGLTHLRNLPGLSSLTLNCLYRANTDDEGYQVLECLTNITYLNISSNYKITDETIERIATHLLSLTSLNVSRTGTTDEGLYSIANHLTNLQKLDISSTKTTDNGITALSKSLKNLKKFDITSDNGYNMPNITSKALYEIGELKNLSALFLTISESLSLAIPLLKDMTNLRKLSIHSHKQLTDGMKMSLMKLQHSRGDIEILISIPGIWHVPLIFDIPYQILK